MRKILIILTVILLPELAFGQSEVKITGNVYDKTTAKPLADANISVAGTGIGAVSDMNGRYRIENLSNGQYRLKVSYVGYGSQVSGEIIVSADYIAKADFYLEPSEIESDEIVISAARDLSDLKLRPDQAAIISSRQLREGNFRNVGEAIRQIPGVEISESGDQGTQTVSIRGSKTSQVLVLVDGVRISAPHGGSADLSMVPVSMIEEIIVVKGGSSAQFGADALGGVVYIKTKSSFSQPLLSLQAGAGDFGSRNVQATLSRNTGIGNIIVNYEQKQSNSDFTYTNEFHEAVKRYNADFYQQHLMLKYTHQTGRSLLRGSFYGNISRRGLPGLIYNLTSKTRSEDTQVIGNFDYRFQMNQKTSLFAQVSYQHYTDADSQETWPAYNTKNVSESVFSELKCKYVFRDGWFVSGGVSQKWDHGNLENISNPLSRRPPRVIQEIRTVNLYQEFTLPPNMLTNAVTLISAYSHTWKKHVENYASPKFGIVIQPKLPVMLSLKANWSKSFKMPDFYDMYFEGYRASGNPDLIPERGEDFDAGVYLQAPLYGRFSSEITAFKRTLTDMIHWRKRFDGVFYPFNLAKAIITGNEYQADWASRHEVLKTGVHYTYMKALNKSNEPNTDNKLLTGRPVYVTHTYVTLNYKNYIFDVKNRWISRRYTREANTKWMAPYTILDFNAGRSFKFHKVAAVLKARALNLLDEEYTIIELAPMPGRTLSFSVELQY